MQRIALESILPEQLSVKKTKRYMKIYFEKEIEVNPNTTRSTI